MRPMNGIGKRTYQILTCVSVSLRDAARPARSDELRYLVEERIEFNFHASTSLFNGSDLFISNVDSSWKTWARENTVRVFFFLLFWELGDALSVLRPSVLSSSSSSIISCSSSDSEMCSLLFRYVWFDWGDFEGADGGGVSDGDKFSALFAELSAKREARKLVIMVNCARQVSCLRIKFPLIVLLVNNSNKHLYSFEAAKVALANINLTFEDMNPLDRAPQLLPIQLHALNPFYLIFSSPFM